jgi:anti-sigma B factor antagonist
VTDQDALDSPRSFHVSVRDDGLPVVTASIDVDVVTAKLLGDMLESAGESQPTIIVDMTDNTYCDSSGLRVLVQAMKRAQASGGELRLVLPRDQARRIFKMTGLDRFFRVFATLDEAALATQPPAAKPVGPD